MMKSLAHALIVVAVILAAPAIAQDAGKGIFITPSLEAFTGVLPDGEFRFAIKVMKDIQPINEFPGIPAGSYITRVQVNGMDDFTITEGQQEMIDALAALGRGDTAFIDTVNASGKSRLTLYLPPTDAQLAERAAEKARQAEIRRQEDENVWENGKCIRAKVVYCEWGMPDYGQLGDSAHICDGTTTMNGIFTGRYSACYGIIGWCNYRTGAAVACPLY